MCKRLEHDFKPDVIKGLELVEVSPLGPLMIQELQPPKTNIT